jgi:hypothetical protein
MGERSASRSIGEKMLTLSFIFSLFVFSLGMLSLSEKTVKGFDSFLEDVVGTVIPERISLIQAFEKEYVADVTGQSGIYGYKVQGKEKVWTIGADCLSKAFVQTGKPIEGGLKEGKSEKLIKLSPESQEERLVSEKEFETSKLGHVLSEACIRQFEKAKHPARKRGKKAKKA